MNRWLGIILCLVIFAGCKKTDDVAASVKAQSAIDDASLVAYIKANNLTAVQVGSPKTDTIGVWYVIEDPGTIPALYTSSTSVTVSYTASVINGTTLGAPFTSTTDSGFNPSYVLGATIKGWQLGIEAAKINKGGKIRLLMSSRYAYGPYPQTQYGQYDNGNYKLPANALLDFEITIFDVTN
ncbi:FKBP-type peptidyl-prolyl cis-trans isomerase [Mucilaginibacter polytrichastri]|nr:FKBP-type peptidyl-prolyl cis-trans isomerase [Mucilaginibacter polytrichastri]